VSTVFSSRRVAPVAAAGLGVLTIGAGLVGLYLGFVAHRSAVTVIESAAFVVPGAVVGALLAARRPRNPIGWIMLGAWAFFAVPSADLTVLDYQIHHQTPHLGWLTVVDSAWPMLLVLLAILLWLFPDGQLPAGRWRKASAAMLAAGVVLGLAAWASGVLAVAANSFQIEVGGPSATVNGTNGTGGGIQPVLVLAVWASWLVWLAVQVPRYRRAGGERRQQLKWLYSGAGVTVGCLVAEALIPTTNGFWSAAADALGVGIAAFPVCVGVAVLRYRLYEIDRIISRTLAYAIVTGLLIGVYAGLVLLATEVFKFHSTVAVAAATLAAAALFSPLRRRVQQVVDRRFNRARYDADQTVAAFAGRLKDAVDLDSVRDDLAGVVNRALEPVHVSVWTSHRD
jgi:hypothetical protein